MKKCTKLSLFNCSQKKMRYILNSRMTSDQCYKALVTYQVLLSLFKKKKRSGLILLICFMMFLTIMRGRDTFRALDFFVSVFLHFIFQVRVFFEGLDEELNKVNQFYKTKESEFLERGEILNKQLEILLDLKRILNERRRKPNAGVLSRSWSSSPRNSDFSGQGFLFFS